jgi:CMP-N-acetylneuraminic acid synthetase
MATSVSPSTRHAGGDRPRVTVYVPSESYGRYLEQALESVARQSLDAWELLVLDDGSVDQTAAVAEAFRARFPDRVRVIRNEQPRGLRACANAALEHARGEFVLRLDADDWLDESALLVLVDFLDRHPEVGLVFPNWTYVDEEGRVLGVERRLQVGRGVGLLDLPAHGACSLVRTRLLKAIGGYDLDLPTQDGHELWLKTLARHGVASVETSLFFYRQHPASLSRDESRLLATRREIKHRAVSAGRGPVAPRVAAIIPVKNSYPHAPNLALDPIGGRPLLDYTLDAVVGNPLFGAVLVASDDEAVLRHCAAHPEIRLHQRASALSDPSVRLEQVVTDAVAELARIGFDPDIVVVLSAHTPLRRPGQIKEAVDTLLLYPLDEVVSTWEVRDLYFRYGTVGMEPVNAGALSDVRLEREALYGSNGSIHAFWRDVLDTNNLLRGRIGHIVMTREESLVAKKPDEWAMLGSILGARSAVGADSG